MVLLICYLSTTLYNIFAGLVAGVGIGMFVFGCLLGALIACIRFRSKGRLHTPFRKDLQHEEFHDDDDNAL